MVVILNRIHESLAEIKENTYDVGIGSMFENPFKVDERMKKMRRRSLRVPTLEDSLKCYREYLEQIVVEFEWVKEAIDEMYEKYKRGETIWLITDGGKQTNADIIKDYIVSRSVKENLEKIGQDGKKKINEERG